MATYKEQIEGLIGTSTPAIADDRYTEYLLDGAQELINLFPKDVLWTLSTTSQIKSGSISSITVSGDGSYSSAPTLTISTPDYANGVQATATCTINSGSIDAITITNEGSGYKSPPTVTASASDSGTDAFTAVLHNDFVSIGTNTILSVTRETESSTLDTSGDGTNDTTSIVECREIQSAQAGRVRPGSGWLEEVTEEDPVFYKKGGKVYILPVPTLKNNRVEFVQPPALAHGESTGLMPKEVDYLVVLFAAVKSLVHHINSISFPEVNNSGFTSDTIGTLLAGPDYTSVDSNFAIALTDYPSVPDNTFIESDGTYINFSTTPTYTAPSPAINLATELSELQTYITDEDLDLAQAKAQKIQLIMGEYQAEQQDANATFQATVNNAQNLLQEAIQEKGTQMSAAEKEKNLQLIMIKSKLERRVQAIQEVLQRHQSKVQVVSTILQEFSAKLNLWDAKKKQKQELQIALMNSYNAGVQALLTRYKGESRQVQNPMVQQQMGMGQQQ